MKVKVTCKAGTKSVTDGEGRTVELREDRTFELDVITIKFPDGSKWDDKDGFTFLCGQIIKVRSPEKSLVYEYAETSEDLLKKVKYVLKRLVE